MKSLKASLGIVFYKNRIAVSEVRPKSPHDSGRITAEFMLPLEQADSQDLMPQAERFKAFLASSGFKERKAAVGLDAARVFTILLDMPPAKDQTLNDEMIRLQLERKTQLDMDETIFGCAYLRDKIFVTAVLKRQIEQIHSFLAASGIRTVCITPVSPAIAAPTQTQPGCCVLEYPESAELLFYQEGQITAFQGIPNGQGLSAFLPRIRQQLDRFALMRSCGPLNCTLLLSRASSLQIKNSAASVFHKCDIQTLSAASPSEVTGVYARRLAEKAVNGQLPQINLLTAMRPRRKLIWSSKGMSKAALAAAAALLIIGFFALDWHLDRAKINDYNQQLESIRDNVKSAQTMIDRTAYARQWFMRSPLYLDILAELTSRFPEQGGIWLNSLAVDESLNQIVTGKAVGEQAVLDVVDNLESSPRFQNIKILYIRQAGKNTREETFAISFSYVRES